MVDNDVYANLERALAADGIRCQFQTPGQFVISSQAGPIWPDRGNSFWVTYVGGRWYLFTWAPFGYLLPDRTRIAALCRTFLGCTDRAASAVPDAIVAMFGLVELTDAEAAAVYRAMPAG